MKVLGMILLMAFFTMSCSAGSKDSRWSGYEDQYRGRRLAKEVAAIPLPHTKHNCFVPVALNTGIRRAFRLFGPKYSVYLHAYGIPIVPFGEANMAALERACYVIKFMLAGNAEIREKMVANKVRFVLLNKTENIESIPEIIVPREHPVTEVFYGKVRPVVVFTEDYVLCESDSNRATRDFMQVVAQAMLKYAIPEVNAYFKTNLRESYYYAINRRVIQGNYAAYSYKEYYSEGVLAYFNRTFVGRLGPQNLNMSTNTREHLEWVDPFLHRLIEFVHPCENSVYVDRCAPNEEALSQEIYPDCKLKPVAGCNDRENGVNCTAYRERNQCVIRREMMEVYCSKTCGFCTAEEEEQGRHITYDIPEEEYDGEGNGVDEECSDADDVTETCAQIAEDGICRRGDYYMWTKENCRASCQFCTPSK